MESVNEQSREGNVGFVVTVNVTRHTFVKLHDDNVNISGHI